MKEIAGAVDLFALESNKADGATVTANDIKKYIKGGAIPQCPADSSAYELADTIVANPAVRCPNRQRLPSHRLSP